MIERNDANLHLMESLYDSAIPDLMHANVQAVREATTMDEMHDPNAPKYLDVSLTPGFLKDSDGLVEDPDKQQEVALEVLAGLHEVWRGSEILEQQVNPHLRKRYWDFMRGFTSWTVVESHSKLQNVYGEHVTAYLVRDTRPATYQQLLTKKFHEEEAREARARHSEVNYPKESEPKAPHSRRQRAAKALGKIIKGSPKNTPPNRWY